MKTKKYLFVGSVLLALGLSVKADILELKNGNILNGKYVGGPEEEVAEFWPLQREYQHELTRLNDNQLNMAVDLQVAASLALIK